MSFGAPIVAAEYVILTFKTVSERVDDKKKCGDESLRLDNRY